MNKLKTAVYEHSMSIVAQTNQGKAQKNKATIAARQLADRAKFVEFCYKKNTITAEDVLKNAAAHYDDNNVMDALANVSEELLETSDIDDFIAGTYTLL